MKGFKLDLRRAAVNTDDDGPSKDWTDVVECVPMALAALLIVYVEDERGGAEKFQSDIDYRIAGLKDDDTMKYNDQAWIAAEIKMMQLYKWWTDRRLALNKRSCELNKAYNAEVFGDNIPKDFEERLNPPETPMGTLLMRARIAVDDLLRAETQEFCEGVVEVREYMWT
jgi:hypothetical protein